MNIQNRDNLFSAGAHAIKKIKIGRNGMNKNKQHEAFSLVKS